MRIDIWSDVVCPYCYIGKRTLDLVLEQFPFRDEVEVIYRSFELYPQASNEIPLKMNDILSMKLGVPLTEIETMQEAVKQKAKKIGLTYRLDNIVQVNTLEAHRLLKYAQTKNKASLLLELLMKAYLVNEQLINSHSVLTKLAMQAGLAKEEVNDILMGQSYLDEVREDRLAAAAMGVNQVPFLVFNNTYALAGAVSKIALREAIRDVWDEENPKRRWHSKPGIVCTSEGCFPIEEK